MASPNRLGDTEIAGRLTARSFTPPTGSVTNDSIQAGAGLKASKLEHRHVLTYGQPGGAASAAERKVIHRVYGATATILDVSAGSRTVNTGNATITVDVYKNGATVLTAPIVLDNANTAYVAEAGTLASTALVDGDVLEVVVTVNAGTGALGNGVFVNVVLNEDAS